jgi:hypothetical protein
MSHYLPPGLPPHPAPAAQPNTYRTPSGPPPQAMQSLSPPPPPEPAPPHADPHHATLISEWRAHHGSDWVRADALHLTVRQLIDERDRIPAIRQKLRQLAATHREFVETKTVGNAARPVTLYRMVGNETA